MKNDSKANRVLTIEERYLIKSHPIYFQSVLTKCALKGELINEIADELEEDWAHLT